MSRKKTHEEFVLEMKKVNHNIEIIGKYKTTNDKIECKCSIHNYFWESYPYHLLSGHGCVKCGREKTIASRKISKEQYLEKMHSVNPNIDIIDDFVNMSTKVHVVCNICNHKWYVAPSSLFKFGCPKCAGNAIKTTDEFEQELHTYASNFELLSPYIRANKKVHVRCNDCGNDDWITPNKLKSGQQCKFCHETIGEKNIRKYLERHNVNFDSQKSFDGLIGVGNKPLTYDFYLPDENILIEFQGEQHEHPVTFGGRSKSEAVSDYEKQQEHDKRKRDYAFFHSINLLEIWYYDMDNIEQILNDKLYKIA